MQAGLPDTKNWLGPKVLKLLADENISEKTVASIRKAGYDIKSIRDIGLKGSNDEKIVDFATKEKRAILTFDLDFGEIYYFSSEAKIGVIVLRLKSQWFEYASPIILKLLKSKKLETEEFKNALVIVTETRYRIRKK